GAPRDAVPAAWLRRRPVAWFMVAISAACLAKVAAAWALKMGAPAALTAARANTPASLFARFVTAGQLLYAVIGVLLIQGSRRDRRAFDLGGFFLLIAASLTTGTVRPSSVGGVAVVAAYLAAVQPESFLPLAWWVFIRDFPRCPGGRGDRVLRGAI